jgi:hypothetical protein
VDGVEVLCPDGETEKVGAVEVNQLITIQEGLGVTKAEPYR